MPLLYRILFSSPQIVKSASLSQNINEALQKCPSDTYVIVSQPAVNAADYHDPEAAPRLGRNIHGDNKNIRSSMTVSDVLGALDVDSVSRQLQEKCGAEVVRIDASSKRSSPPILMGLKEVWVVASNAVFAIFSSVFRRTERHKDSCHSSRLFSPSYGK